MEKKKKKKTEVLILLHLIHKAEENICNNFRQSVSQHFTQG